MLQGIIVLAFKLRLSFLSLISTEVFGRPTRRRDARSWFGGLLSNYSPEEARKLCKEWHQIIEKYHILLPRKEWTPELAFVAVMGGFEIIIPEDSRANVSPDRKEVIPLGKEPSAPSLYRVWPYLQF